MDALFDALAKVIVALFTDPRNIAVLVSMAANVALAWAHVVWRREERTDREHMLETFNNLTKALNDFRAVLSAVTGKAIG